MARYIGLAEDVPRHRSEAEVASALRQLPAPWVVLHHVSWQANRHRRQGDGEADFVILHPRYGALILEVKGGDIELRAGRWFSEDHFGREHEIKNPYEQAVDSKHALVEWLRGRGAADGIRIGHAVVFPKPTVMPNLGPAATREVTWLRGDLASISDTVARTVRYWSLEARLTDIEFNRLVDALAPTVSFRKKLRDVSAEAEAGVLQFTAEQVRAFAGIRAARRALIVGTAGTGKTVLATARALQLAADGFKTLLLCYNDLLGQQLAASLSGTLNVEAGSFHGYAMRIIRQARLEVPQQLTDNWWETQAADALVEACAKLNLEFDAMVVDEAQDFAPAWLSALDCLKSPEAEAAQFLFADPRQDLYGRGWGTGREWDFVYELTCNMRNTRPIAQRVAAAGGFECDVRAADGPAPLWRDAHEPRRIRSDALAMIERMIEEGFGPDSLVVLCTSPAMVDQLRRETIGPYSLGAWGSRGIPVETVARFKGLEAEAVVLVMSDEPSSRADALAYVGMSRARSVLALVAPPQMRATLGWVHAGAVTSK